MCYICNVDINNIKKGNTLEVFVSRDKSFVKINCITSFAEGEVTEISADGTLNVGGQYIDVTDYFTRNYKNSISVGGRYSFALNSQGLAVAVETGAGGTTKLAYFDNMKKKENVLGAVQIKLFSEDGKVLLTELADRVTVNGNGKTKENAYMLLQNYIGALVRYRLDDSEKVTEIISVSGDGTYDSSADGGDALKRFRFVGDDTDKKIYYKSFGYFVPYFVVDSATKIFVVSTDEKDDAKKFTMGSLSFLNNDAQVPSNSVVPYNVNVGGCAGALLYKSSDAVNVSLDPTSSAAIVAGMSEAADEDGEKVFKIKLYTGDKYYYYFIKKDSNFVRIMNLKDGEYPFMAGDVIRYSLDKNREYIINALKDFDSKSKTLLYNADYNTELHYFYGSIYAIESTSIAIKCPDGSMVYVPLTLVNAGMCEDGEVLTTPREQIQSYIQTGDACDKILIKCRYSSPVETFIYR